jgi:hypothetical protein
MKQKKVINVLENLVGKRFCLETLEMELKERFKLDDYIGIVDVTPDKDECDTSDWNLMGCLNAKGIFCDFDIYFLNLRKKDWDGNTFYVTEVGYEFQ